MFGDSSSSTSSSSSSTTSRSRLTKAPNDVDDVDNDDDVDEFPENEPETNLPDLLREEGLLGTKHDQVPLGNFSVIKGVT